MSRPRKASALLIRNENLPKRVCWMICGLFAAAHTRPSLSCSLSFIDQRQPA
jgi:hypothetical protein